MKTQWGLLALSSFLMLTNAVQADVQGRQSETIPVAITFDDLGVTGSAVTEKIARSLQDAGVAEAYGFVNGSFAKADADHLESLRVWTRYGFPMGSHTYSHHSLVQLTPEAYIEDIVANEALVAQFALPGSDWHWFRYPHLAEGETMAKRQAIRNYLKAPPSGQPYRIAEVTIDFPDWIFNAAYLRCRDIKDVASMHSSIQWLKQTFLKKAVHEMLEARKNSRDLFGRDIPQILLIHYSSFVGEVMADLLKAYKDHGAEFITLKEAQADPIFQTDIGQVFPNGENFLTGRILARDRQNPAPTEAPVSSWKREVKALCTSQP